MCSELDVKALPTTYFEHTGCKVRRRWGAEAAAQSELVPARSTEFEGAITGDVDRLYGELGDAEKNAYRGPGAMRESVHAGVG